MKFNTPLLEYTSIQLNGTEVELNGTARARVSFSSPYNKIDITFKPTNTSLSYYEARVTEDGEPYGIGVGNRAYTATSIPLNASHTFSLNITPDVFDKGDSVYRISLYAKSALDGSWDTVHLFITFDNARFILANDNGPLGVLTTQDIPSN
jgi:hypothetical protein